MTNMTATYAGGIQPSVPPPLDESVVERFTGQRAVRTVEAAEAALSDATTELATAQTRLQQARVRAANAGRRRNMIAFAKFFLAAPAALRVEPWVFLLILACLAGLAGGLTFGILFGGGAGWGLAGAIVPFSGLMALLPFFTPSSTQRLRRWLIEAEMTRQAAATEVATAQVAAEAAQRRHTTAVNLHQGMLQARAFPLNRLLSVEFRLLSGSQFEDYLGDVFRFLGYSVQQTGKSGDQGVDLIVSRGEGQIAVQAKCYGQSVGNSAVQQVFAGMQFYKCQRCAVIASAQFTSGAIELAQAVGCRLIGLDDIRRLVRGEILL